MVYRNHLPDHPTIKIVVRFHFVNISKFLGQTLFLFTVQGHRFWTFRNPKIIYHCSQLSLLLKQLWLFFETHCRYQNTSFPQNNTYRANSVWIWLLGASKNSPLSFLFCLDQNFNTSGPRSCSCACSIAPSIWVNCYCFRKWSLVEGHFLNLLYCSLR